MFYDLKDKKPKNSGENWVAPNAVVIGDVTLDKNSSIWFNATLRGDIENIHIGEGSNVQDGSVLQHPQIGSVREDRRCGRRGCRSARSPRRSSLRRRLVRSTSPAPSSERRARRTRRRCCRHTPPRGRRGRRAGRRVDELDVQVPLGTVTASRSKPSNSGRTSADDAGAVNASGMDG